MNNDNLRRVRQTLLDEGYTPPEYDEFEKDMQDENNLRGVHETLKKAGYTPPEFEQFRKDMGFGEVKAATPKDNSQPYAGMTVNIPDGMTYTAAGLDSLDKGATPKRTEDTGAATVLQHREPVDLTRPEDYEIPKPFVEGAEAAQQLAQSPDLNKYWANRQQEAVRRAMVPKGDFEYRQLGWKEAQEAEAARRMNRSEFDKSNLEDFYQQHVAPVFAEERAAGEQRAKDAVRERIRREIAGETMPQNVAGVMSGIGRAFQTSVDVERETDPERIATNTLKRVQGDEAFGDYVLARMGIDGKNADEMHGGEESPQLTEREKKYMQMLFARENGEVADQMIQRIYDQYKAEGAPKSALEYIAGKAFHENFASSLYQALVRRAAKSSGIRDQLRAMASEEYAKDANWATRAAGSAAPFAVDILTGGFALPSVVGNALIKGGTKLAAKEVTKEMSKRAAARGLKDAALEEAVRGGEAVAERYIATQAPILNLALRSAGSAANFATYDVQSELVRQLSEGKFSAADLMKQAVHGATLGGIMGATGGLIANATRNSGLTGKVLGDIAGLGTETGIFAAANGLQKAYELGIDITDVDWADTTGEALGMVVGMKTVGAAMHPKEFVKRYRQSKDLGLQLNQRDLDELKRAGYDFDGIIKGLGKFGEIAPESATVRRAAAEYTVDSEGKRSQRNTETQEAYVDADAFNTIMSNPEISSSVKRKLAYIATGQVLSVEPTFGATMNVDDNGKATITTLNAAGNVIETKEYDSKEAAEKDYQVLQEVARTNTIGGLERIADKAGFQSVKDVAKARTESETGMDVNDVEKLSELSNEDVNQVLDSYIKNLQDAYMEEFNKNAKRLGEIPAVGADGEATTGGGVQRSERRQAAYERGASAVEDDSQVPGMTYDSQMATARMMALLPDGDERAALVRNKVMQAVEAGDMAGAEQALEQFRQNLTDKQAEAVENYLDAQASQAGMQDAISQQIADYEAQAQVDVANKADEQGTVTELLMKDGSTAYLKTGDLNAYHGQLIVTTEDGEQKQVSTADVAEVVGRQDAEEFVVAVTQQHAEQLRQMYEGLAAGTWLKDGQNVELAIGGTVLGGNVLGRDGNGNYVVQFEDGSRWPMIPEEVAAYIQEANRLKIEQTLIQEKEADAMRQRTERFNAGIVGYAEGTPDLTHKDTKPEVAAEWLLSQTDAEGQPVERKTAIEDVRKQIEHLVQSQERVSQARLQAYQNLAMSEEGDEQYQQAAALIRQLEPQLEDMKARQRKWGEIRQAMMTNEERQQFEGERIRTIGQAKSKSLKEAQAAQNTDANATGTVAVPSGKELVEQYPERADGEAFVEGKRKEVSKQYKEDVYPKYDDIEKTLNDYQRGLIELSADELKELTDAQAVLSLQMNQLVEQQNQWKKLGSDINKLYNTQERKQMTPHELAISRLQNETDKTKKIKLAQEAFKDDPEALAMLEDMEPRDVNEWVAAHLGAGSINWEGLQRGEHYVRGLRDELGKDKTRGIGAKYDTNAYNQFLAPEGQGKGIDEVVHNMAEGSSYDPQDVKNALLTMLSEATKPTDISHYIENSRIAEAERIYEANLERQRDEELEAENDAIREMTGMEPDEYDAYMGDLEQRLAEQAGYQNSEEYFKNVVEYERRAKERSIGGGQETGALGVQGQESRPADAEANAEGGAGETVAEGGARETVAEGGVDQAPIVPSRYQLSKTEKDAEGNAFYEKNGSIDLWSMPELFAKARRQAAPIRFTERNLKHILNEHSKEIGDTEKVFDFLDDVFKNAKVLRPARGRAMFVIVENDKTNKAAVIKLMPSDTGDYYNVETAGYYRKDKWKNDEDVIADLREPGQSDAAADVSKPQTPNDNGGEPINAKTQTSSSEGKGTENISEKQENEEKSEENFAARLAGAKEEVNTAPTDEQKKAGNYKMGHISFGGYKMSIENPKGSIRSGVDKSGKPWSIEMKDTYGYIGQKYGADGDHLDFFINDDADLDNWNGRVFVIDQKNDDGTFDEHKVMYGYPSWRAARNAYERNYEPGWWDKHVMQMTGVKKDKFDKWLDDSDHKTKPFSEYYRTKILTDVVSDNVDQVLADVRERKNKPAGEAAGTVASFKPGELTKKSMDELRQVRKKAKQDLSTAKVLLGTIDDIRGTTKEKSLQSKIAQAEADIAAIDAEIEKKEAIVRRRAEQQEIGFAMTDQLEGMGFDVTTNPTEMRKARKQAEKDNSEEGKLRHFETPDGKLYGFVYKGKMYLDPTKIDAELPIHEYAHPWCEAFRRLNPEGWQHIVDLMKSDKDTWDFVKQLNPDLKDESDIAEEMIAKFSGKKGAERAQAEYERMNGRDPEYKSKWGNIWKNISKAIQDFWKQVGDFLHIRYESVEQVYDQVVRDFANKMNPRKRVEDWLKERDDAYMQAVKAGDDAKTKEIFDEALRENIGNGITPFVAVDGYRGKMQKLAHAIKERAPKVIAEVADMMAPLIPKDAVLVPAPSHTGRATDMLDLAQAISERTGAPVADVLRSKERGSQYKAKYAGRPIASSEMGIVATAEPLPADKLPVVIDNVVDTGNTAEACVQALGKGIVASLADSADRYKHVVSLKSAEPVVQDKNGNVVPLSKRFEIGGKYLEKAGRPGADASGTAAESGTMVSEDGAEPMVVKDADAIIHEMERRKQVAEDKKKAEDVVKKYLAKKPKSEEDAARQRATKAVLKAMSNAGVPYKVVSKAEEKDMLRIFSMMNQAPIKEMARRASVRSVSKHGIAPYIIYNMSDPFGMPMYFEKLSTAQYALKGLKHAAPEGDWEIMYIGWGDEAAGMPQQNLRDAANLNPELKTVITLDDGRTVQFMFGGDVAGETSEREQPIFFSNALKVVEGIKQEKGTPEQWLKMLEKNGGIKAGEDRWTGLTEWLRSKNDIKGEQLKLILNSNPHDDSIGFEHTWIRQKEDIKTFEESFGEDYDIHESQAPDYTAEMISSALRSGKITVYSSHPIEDGAFVTPSKMEAQNYAGSGQVYSKEINLKDVAWIDPMQGQYAPVKSISLTKSEIEDYLKENMIEVEEVEYMEAPPTEYGRESLSADEVPEVLRQRMSALNERFHELFKQAKQHSTTGEARNWAYNTLHEEYGADFSKAFGTRGGDLVVRNAGEIKTAGDVLGVDIAENIINSTRLNYTTIGLDNKREIALVVPTVEPYNASDEIHFGDAGGGRAVAWVRFGETEEYDKTAKDALDAASRELYDYLDRMTEKYNVNPDTPEGFEDKLTPEEKAEHERIMADIHEKEAAFDATKKKVLVIDEIQSKRHQDAREKGYADGKAVKAYNDWMDAKANEYGVQRYQVESRLSDEEYSEMKRLQEAAKIDNGVPDAPFDKNWHELAMKRMLRYAAENGFDKVAWTKGEQQAERYNLSEKVDEIKVTGGADNIFTVIARKDGGILVQQDAEGEKGLADIIGKELARKAYSNLKEGKEDYLNEDGAVSFTGDNLRIGGEGMKSFYDEILPRFMNKYGKKWGVKVEDMEMPEDLGERDRLKRLHMWSIDVTPEMKESVMQGQPMFQKEGKRLLGWSDGKQVYLTDKGLNPNTPLHETTHLWDNWCQKEHPDLWKKLVAAMKKTQMWEDISKNPNYRSIWNDDNRMASEVHARLSGAVGEDEFVKAAFKKNTPQSIINEVKSALRKFWEAVLRLFGKRTKTIADDWSSLDAIVRMPIMDLVGQDFEKVMKVAEDVTAGTQGTIDGHIVDDKAEIAAVAEATGEQLGGVGVKTVSYEDADGKLKKEIENGTKGIYNPNTGEVTLLVDNIQDVNDAQRTVCHEKLGHEGLVALLGSQEEVNKFGTFIFRSAGKKLRQRILERADEEGYSWSDPLRLSKAAQEVFAEIAADGPATEEEFSLWDKVKHYIIRACKAIGLKVRGLLNDHDLRYYVLKTGEALKKWNQMDEEARQNLAQQSTRHDIMRSRNGKPRQRRGESMASYMQRLSEWEKWRIARQTARDNNDPEPTEEQFHERAEAEYQADLKEWKEQNGIPAGRAAGAGAFPRREAGESPQEYAVRVADYEAENDLWQTAPNYMEYMRKASDDYRQAYLEWRLRYDLQEEATVDQRLYEGDVEPEPTFTDADEEARAYAERDLADELGIEIDEAGAKRHAKLAVIERRKNMESANAEDAIWVYDFVKKTDEVAKSVGENAAEVHGENAAGMQGGKEVPTGKELRAALPFLIEADRRRENMKAEKEEAIAAINMSEAVQQAHSFLSLENLEQIGDEVGALEEAWQAKQNNPSQLADMAYREAARALADRLNELNKDYVGYQPLFADDVMQIRSLLVHAMASGGGEVMPASAARFAGVPEVQQLMEHVKEWYDEFFALLEDAGLRGDAGYIEDGYVNHVWDKEKSDPKAWEKFVENRQRTKSPNMRHREIDTYMDGIKVGLVPKYTDIADMIAHYSRQNNEAIANSRFLDDFKGLYVREMNDEGEVTAVLPVLETEAPAFTRDRYVSYYVPGVGDVYVLKEVKRPLDTVLGSMRTQGVGKGLQNLGKAWDMTGAFAKKVELALSGFHALALFEVDMAQHPIQAWKHLFKYILFDGLKKDNKHWWGFSTTRPAYAHPEDFKFAAKHLVQLGATEDYAASDVNAITDNLKKFMLDKYSTSEGAARMLSLTGLRAAEALDFFNKGFDAVLWNYLHDGLKLAAFKELAKQVDRKVAKNGLSEDLREKLLDEAGQYVNDLFGGQFFDIINFTPAEVKWARRILLSPDWTISSMVRLPGAMAGLGGLYTEKGFMNYLKYWKRKVKGEKVDEDYIRDFRMKYAALCYLGAAVVIGLLFVNLANMWNRREDEEEQRKIAEEMRKTDPNYKSPYELKYPDGMKWYDYTLWGNARGHKTHLFTGRYNDGSERYARWGKHFREVPELLEGEHGIEFPSQFLNRMKAKQNPNISMLEAIFGLQGMSGYEADYHYQDIMAKYGKNIATATALARHFVPFGISLDPQKEWYPLDFFMPSSKGYRPWKAKRDLEYYLLRGDEEGCREVYNSCVMNGVDYEECLKAAISSIKATQRKELSGGVTDLSSAVSKFDSASDPRDKAVYLNKIKKYLREEEYKTLTMEEAEQKVHQYLSGENIGEKENARYIWLATSADIIAEEKLKDIKSKASKLKKELEEKHDSPEYDDLKQRYSRWIKAGKIADKATRAINKSKKKLGAMKEDSIMENIRETVREAQNKIDELQAPK